MKPAEIVLKWATEERERMMEGVNLGYIISTYVNITMYPLHNYYMLSNKKRQWPT
jgi:hypothetical protein